MRAIESPLPGDCGSFCFEHFALDARPRQCKGGLASLVERFLLQLEVHLLLLLLLLLCGQLDKHPPERLLLKLAYQFTCLENILSCVYSLTGDVWAVVGWSQDLVTLAERSNSIEVWAAKISGRNLA